MYISKTEAYMKSKKYLKLEEMYCLNKDVWNVDTGFSNLLFWLIYDIVHRRKETPTVAAVTVDIKGIKQWISWTDAANEGKKQS